MTENSRIGRAFRQARPFSLNLFTEPPVGANEAAMGSQFQAVSFLPEGVRRLYFVEHQLYGRVPLWSGRPFLRCALI